MTDRNEPEPLPPPTPSEAVAENAPAEDLACLQAALEDQQRERARRLPPGEAGVQARLQRAEQRLHQATSQLEATQRRAQAMRARLEAELQASRTRAETAQAALAANQAISEDLRVANAELSTAIDAAQWRLGELEAENAAQREALLHLEEARHTDLQRIAELEHAFLERQEAAAAAAVQQAEASAAVDALHTRAAALQETLEQLRAERDQLLAAHADTDRQLADQGREREVLQQRLGALEAERATSCEREAALRGELEAENTAQREALLRLEEARHADLQRLAELEHAFLDQQQAAAAAAVQQAEATAAADALHTRAAALQEAVDQLRAERDQLLAAHAEASRQLADQGREREELQQRLGALEAERAASCEREAALRRELEDVRRGHDAVCALAEQELAALRARLLAEEQQHQQLDEQLVAARAAAERITVQHQSECDAIAARARSLEEALEQRGDQLGGVENELQRLQAAHAAELAAWQDTVAQREAELVASRDTLAQQLANEHALASNIFDDAAAFAARVESLDADLQAARERCRQLEQEVAAAQAERVEIEARHESDRTSLEEEAQQLRVAQAEAVQRRQEQSAHDAAERQALTSRLTLVNDELRQRDTRIEQLQTDLARLEAEQAQALQTTVEAGRRREEEWRATARTLQEELECARRNLQESNAACAAARIAELDNERGTLSMRVDELTALTGQLERECERLRRDRGSTEELRRLKADNARLEAKIVDLDRQRTEGVQRHSAAVAGYMVELNQRSEALRARDVELQRLTEELALVKQSCEDAVSDLTAQRQQQATLERQLAELRTAPRPVTSPPPSEAAAAAGATSPHPDSVLAPAAARATAAKPAKRPAGDDASTSPASVTQLPVTVIHLEDNQPLCQAVCEVVARVPGSRYLNAFDSSALNGVASSMLAVNLLGRAYDPLEAIASFVADDTFHKNVFAYCLEGATGFSFGSADFFSQPLDPDTCVAQLLESCGAIQRLLVASENFGVVGGLRAVLSRMRSSVAAALDLRQVIDLLPMVAPDVILVDLSLPRGEGLRLVGRLRADPKTGDLPLGILLPAQGNAAEFRQQALRAARDLPMSAADLTTALSRRLGASASPALQRPATTALA